MSAAERPWERPGQHWVDGRWVSCCETGETCPCACHDETDHAPEEPTS